MAKHGSARLGSRRLIRRGWPWTWYRCRIPWPAVCRERCAAA